MTNNRLWGYPVPTGDCGHEYKSPAVKYVLPTEISSDLKMYYQQQLHQSKMTDI